MNINEARVLVTGGSSGIGRGIAELLVQRGAKVAISGRDERRLNEAAGVIGAAGLQGDVSIEAEAIRIVRQARDVLGGYNVLVNNAGIGAFAPLVDITADDMRRVWEVNVLGATLVARESAQHFVSQKYGTIINIGSTSALRGGAGSSAYASTKFALRGLSETWRTELRSHNVRVMLLNPSEVVTEFFGRSGLSQTDNPTKLHPRDIAHAAVAMLEMDDAGFIPELTVWATNPKE
jgi:3-oxoacyl-[acyl-carrier protein] reductase